MEIGGLEPSPALAGDPLRALADLMDSLAGVPQQLRDLQQQVADLWNALTLDGPQQSRNSNNDSRAAK